MRKARDKDIASQVKLDNRVRHLIVHETVFAIVDARSQVMFRMQRNTVAGGVIPFWGFFSGVNSNDYSYRAMRKRKFERVLHELG